MYTSGVVFIVLIVASFIQVVTRYVFNASLTGTEELARYCYIWMSLLGGSIAVGRWAHTSISILYDRLKGKPKKILFIFYNICVILLSLIFITGGITVMKISANQMSPSLHISKALVYLAVPLSGFGMLMHALEFILGNIENMKNDNVDPARIMEVKT